VVALARKDPVPQLAVINKRFKSPGSPAEGSETQEEMCSGITFTKAGKRKFGKVDTTVLISAAQGLESTICFPFVRATQFLLETTSKDLALGSEDRARMDGHMRCLPLFDRQNRKTRILLKQFWLSCPSSVSEVLPALLVDSSLLEFVRSWCCNGFWFLEKTLTTQRMRNQRHSHLLA
jgi:hypothetical protein